jgi:hypothetical protein
VSFVADFVFEEGLTNMVGGDEIVEVVVDKLEIDQGAIVEVREDGKVELGW